MTLETLTLIKDFLNLFIVPLFLWIWFTDRKLNRLDTTSVKKDDLKEFYQKLEEIRKDIHSLNDKYVSQKSCDFRHAKIT